MISNIVAYSIFYFCFLVSSALAQENPNLETQSSENLKIENQKLESAKPAVHGSGEETSSAIVASWPAEGFTAPGYGVFRDDLMMAILQAKQRVAIVTEDFRDGDLATALYRAKLKGIKVLVILNSHKKPALESRASYLSRVNISVMTVQTSSSQYAKAKWGGKTTFVLDDKAFRMNLSLDERQVGSVRIDGSPFTADEIFKLETEMGVKRFLSSEPGEFTPMRKRRIPSAASSEQPATVPSSTSEVSKSSRALSSSAKAKRLPRETILQQRTKGNVVPLAPNPSLGGQSDLQKMPIKQQQPPENESDLLTE